MEAPKVILSDAERRLITDVNVILTKNSSLKKIEQLFGRLAAKYLEIPVALKKSFPTVFDTHPKISKGEKHKNLPWLMLDYPRCFDKLNGHLAIRTFFWWGNYFSIQLQVSGNYLPEFLAVYPVWKQENNGWYSGISYDPWDMELPNKNWNEPGENNANDAGCFLKVAKKIPIDDWDNLEKICSAYFSSLTTLICMAIIPQGDEIIP